MRDTIAYIRRSLQDIYPSGELQALIRLIMESVCGLTTCQLLVGKDRELSEIERSKINEIVTGLRQEEPIQYLLGEAYFKELTLQVNPSVLIPRPETAELVDRIAADYAASGVIRLLDIGTGSGCIAIALARALPQAEVNAFDISAEALSVAKENARRNRAAVAFSQADILKATPPTSAYNVIVSNPPYIMLKEKAQMERNVLDHEPHLALFVPDEDPLRFYRAIADYARVALRPGGRLYFEINPLCQDSMRQLLEEKSYKQIEILSDFYGKARFTIATL